MTIPLIVLAALSVLGGVMLLGDWIVEWLAPVVGEQRARRAADPGAGDHRPRAPGRRRRAPGWRSCSSGRREVPREAPQDVSFATRAARADLYGDAINDGLVVEPSRHLTAGLLTFDRTVVDGTFSGGATTVGAHRDPAQAGAERLRPLLRGLDPGRRAARGPGPAGGEPRMSDLPLLTILILVPLVGALAVAFLPGGRRPAQAARRARQPGDPGRRGRHRGVVRRRRRRPPADRDPRVDLRVRRALRARRRRPRPADDPADRRAWSRSS